jgi:hypothetical protein
MTEVQKASMRMFGPGGLGITNFNVFPGERSDLTAEDIAGELNKMLDQLESGNYHELQFDDVDLLD